MRASSTSAIPEGSPYARHLPPLDGIRGLAILAVVGSHLFPANVHSSFQLEIHNILEFGANGVDLFFVLSGFLITGILYDSLSDAAFFRKFYARRILRIFPLYYGVLAAFALAAVIFHLNFHHELLSHALYLQNSSLIAPQMRNYAGPSDLPIGHFWSLAIEEQFYLVWPITVFCLRRKRRLLLFCAAAILLCPILRFLLEMRGVDYFTIHTNTLCRADSLLAGGALALLLRSRFHDRVLRSGIWLFGAGLLGILLWHTLIAIGLVGRVSNGFRFILAVQYSVLAMCYAGLIALALRSHLVGGLFSARPMRWFGRYSYGIYVLHLILFSYLEGPLRNAIQAHITPNKGAGVVLTGLLILGISMIAAYLSYNLYEKHFLRLKRFFDYNRPFETVEERRRIAESNLSMQES